MVSREVRIRLSAPASRLVRCRPMSMVLIGGNPWERSGYSQQRPGVVGKVSRTRSEIPRDARERTRERSELRVTCRRSSFSSSTLNYNRPPGTRRSRVGNPASRSLNRTCFFTNFLVSKSAIAHPGFPILAERSQITPLITPIPIIWDEVYCDG